MRADGKRLRNCPPMYTVAAHFMAKRSDAMNMIELDVPMQPVQEYLHRIRKEGHNISHLTLFIAAILRITAEYPYLNRFVVNKRIYARKGYSVGMVVLKPGEKDGTMNKIHLDVEDNLFTVQDKVDAYISQNRGEGDTNSTDKIIRILLSIPGLCRIGVCLIKFLDKLGLLPRAIIDASPFHTSLVITNLASIRTNHIYHHIYDFGTTSMAFAMGNTRLVPKMVKDEVVFEKCMPIGLVMDERICSGTYYAAAFRRFKEYLAKPELLEEPPRVLNREI